MRDKILPCECGNKNIKVFEDVNPPFSRIPNSKVWIVGCGACGADEFSLESENNAIEMWNANNKEKKDDD